MERVYHSGASRQISCSRELRRFYQQQLGSANRNNRLLEGLQPLAEASDVLPILPIHTTLCYDVAKIVSAHVGQNQNKFSVVVLGQE